MTNRQPRHPLADVGARFRLARERAGLLQRELAKKAKMRPAQLSLVENGYNVEARFYATIAAVLGYPSVTSLLRAMEEPETKRLQRLWDTLETPERRRLLRKIEAWL